MMGIASTFTFAQDRYTVQGRITGLSGNAIVYVGIFNSSQWSVDETEPTWGVQIQPNQVQNGQAIYRFLVPPGDYVISVFEDRDGNQRLSKNFFGYPTEPFGFYREYRPGIRAPRFDDFKFSVTRSITTAHITMQNR